MSVSPTLMCDYTGCLSQMSLQQRRHALVTLLTRWQAFKENKRDRSPSKQSDTMLDPWLQLRLCILCCSSDYAALLVKSQVMQLFRQVLSM